MLVCCNTYYYIVSDMTPSACFGLLSCIVFLLTVTLQSFLCFALKLSGAPGGEKAPRFLKSNVLLTRAELCFLWPRQTMEGMGVSDVGQHFTINGSLTFSLPPKLRPSPLFPYAPNKSPYLFFVHVYWNNHLPVTDVTATVGAWPCDYLRGYLAFG